MKYMEAAAESELHEELQSQKPAISQHETEQ
jgi:hypothetical protein